MVCREVTLGKVIRGKPPLGGAKWPSKINKQVSTHRWMLYTESALGRRHSKNKGPQTGKPFCGAGAKGSQGIQSITNERQSKRQTDLATYGCITKNPKASGINNKHFFMLIDWQVNVLSRGQQRWLISAPPCLGLHFRIILVLLYSQTWNLDWEELDPAETID